jgi:hypothetical protein
LKIKVNVNDGSVGKVKFGAPERRFKITLIRKMSSHHFVKEGQEPALFILDNMPFHYAESLLEWVPLVMVADRALESVLHWGIKIDVVLQDKYSFEVVEDLVKDQGPVQTLLSDKGHIVNTGLKYLAQNGYDAVNVLSTPQEEIFKEVEKSAHKLQVAIYNEREKWSLITTGKFEKWMAADTTLLMRSAASVQTKGIIQKGKFWETIGSGTVTIQSESAFWIRENA